MLCLRSVNNVNLVEFVELFVSLKRDKICHFNRRSTRRKNLHQKLVMSQMNAKKAAKLDMDDRAKIVQYFQRFFRLFILPFLHIFDYKSSQWSKQPLNQWLTNLHFLPQKYLQRTLTILLHFWGTPTLYILGKPAIIGVFQLVVHMQRTRDTLMCT